MQDKTKAILSGATQEEKLRLLAGKDYWRTMSIERLGLPSIMMSDGPHGLRKQDGNENALGLGTSVRAVCFPTAAGTAASFNRDLLRRLGETLGAEARSEKLAITLGPGVNIKRSPLCGRNFEYFSEDPYLSAEMAVAYTQGMQSKGVGVSVKHFAANNQEKRRMTVRSVVDERALREIYLPAFEETVKRADPWTVMCAYNRLFEGLYCAENKRLLTDILRKEWGYRGLVVSDWGAVSDRVKGVAAGMDLEMPGGELNLGKLRAAFAAGELTQEEIDLCCMRLIELVLRAEEAARVIVCPPCDWAQDHEAARAFARESMVLLKNEGALPLRKGQKVAFLGGFAKKPRFQGGGSSHVNPFRVVSALEAAALREDLQIDYAEGFGTEDYEYDPVLARAAVQLAKKSEAAVIFAGLPESMDNEGADRQHIDLPPCQVEFIHQIAQVQPNVVVVLHNGSAVRMPWIGEARAVLEAYLAGEAIGAAQLDLLFGDYSPSAKLAETFPLRLQDTPCYPNFPGNPLTVEYRESIYVGYRYYDKSEKEVLFPFGHGLSYTSFHYSDLKLSAKKLQAGDALEVSLFIENSGAFDAAEVVQIYLAPPEGAVFRPARELAGFAKVFLKVGEKQRVTLNLTPRAFAYYHTGLCDWYIENGSYRVIAAASSRDLRLSATVKVHNGIEAPAPYAASALPHYESGEAQQVSSAEFEALLGFPLPPAHYPEGSRHRLNWDGTLEEAQGTRLGRGIAFFLQKGLPLAGKLIGDIGSLDAIAEAALEMPFRTMASWSQGMLTADMVDALCNLFNEEHRIKAVGTLLKGGVQAVRKLCFPQLR
ncbi:MAG: glycoside hydrolase family 3 C-terminal domain-containing protein [Oscillospiraceae bacterium]|jgi:beta-glucosidase|nr:glycoside hydrolase family 3 C-terminal domain-containing protein [Oscillospiraceae bacterium]